MKPGIESQQLFRGAFILTGAALVTKILSAFYRIPFQNIVGDIGFYIYQQVYPFYGMMLILATQGFPVIISKVYNEQLTKEDPQKGIRFLVISFFFLNMFGVVLFLFFFLGADWIARTMGDGELAPLFKIMAFPFLIFPFTACFRGYFQGKGNMVPTALSQVGEQFIRVVTILIISFLLVESGYSLYAAGSGAVFGSVTGGLVGLWILGSFFLRSNHMTLKKEYHLNEMAKEAGPVIKVLMLQGFAISISSMILILIQLADALSLYNLLTSTGMTEAEAKVAKGVFDRGQPLIQLGTIIATSIALSLVPAISGKKQKAMIIQDVRIALQVSLVVGAAAAVGLFSIIEPANVMLFENEDGSSVLALLSLMILPGSVLITIVGVLQGLSYMYFPAFMIIGAFGLKYMLNTFLVPEIGTIGAAAASIISISFALLFLIAKLRRAMQQRILASRFIIKVLIISVIMGIFLTVYLKLTQNFAVFWDSERIFASAQVLTAIVLGAILYLLLVIRMRLLQEPELLMVPFGNKLLFLLPKKTGDD